jgi:hypothetical protein
VSSGVEVPDEQGVCIGGFSGHGNIVNDAKRIDAKLASLMLSALKRWQVLF